MLQLSVILVPSLVSVEKFTFSVMQPVKQLYVVMCIDGI